MVQQYHELTARTIAAVANMAILQKMTNSNEVSVGSVLSVQDNDDRQNALSKLPRGCQYTLLSKDNCLVLFYDITIYKC